MGCVVGIEGTTGQWTDALDSSVVSWLDLGFAVPLVEGVRGPGALAMGRGRFLWSAIDAPTSYSFSQSCSEVSKLLMASMNVIFCALGNMLEALN